MDKCMNKETDKMIRNIKIGCAEMHKTDFEGRYGCFQSFSGGRRWGGVGSTKDP